MSRKFGEGRVVGTVRSAGLGAEDTEWGGDFETASSPLWRPYCGFHCTVVKRYEEFVLLRATYGLGRGQIRSTVAVSLTAVESASTQPSDPNRHSCRFHRKIGAQYCAIPELPALKG